MNNREVVNRPSGFVEKFCKYKYWSMEGFINLNIRKEEFIKPFKMEYWVKIWKSYTVHEGAILRKGLPISEGKLYQNRLYFFLLHANRQNVSIIFGRLYVFKTSFKSSTDISCMLCWSNVSRKHVFEVFDRSDASMARHNDGHTIIHRWDVLCLYYIWAVRNYCLETVSICGIFCFDYETRFDDVFQRLQHKVQSILEAEHVLLPAMTYRC